MIYFQNFLIMILIILIIIKIIIFIIQIIIVIILIITKIKIFLNQNNNIFNIKTLISTYLSIAIPKGTYACIGKSHYLLSLTTCHDVKTSRMRF